MNESSYFRSLQAVGMADKEKDKRGLTYIDWASVWAELKKQYPYSYYEIHRTENGRPWFDDGRTGWVTVTVTVVIDDGKEIAHTVDLPIMNPRNESIPANEITSVQANKAYQRCLVKACAMHGLGMYVYAKMEDTEENIEITKLQKECMELIKKKASISEDMKKKVEKLCVEADETANGDPRLIEDVDTLKELKRNLQALRVSK